MYNQHTRGITTAGHRDRDEGRKDFVRDLTHTYAHKKIIDGKTPIPRTNKKGFKYIEFPA